MSNSIDRPSYGIGNASYLAAGELDGLRKLCEDFYHVMDTLDEAKIIRQMHQDDLAVMVDKLTLFLAMWLGGPRLYHEKYGFIGMPQAHQHLVINQSEKKAWLLCMNIALEKQDYELSFKRYLYNQLCKPAEVIYRSSRKHDEFL